MAEKKFTKGLFANEKTSQYGTFMNLDIKATEFCEWVKANTNEQGYCKISLYKAKDGSASKNTHYGVLNEFVPVMKAKEGATVIYDDSDPLPF
jgi:hypothetical protein